MIVWLPTAEANARPLPYPTLTTSAKLTASGRKSPEPIHDGDEPSASNDPTSYFDWWPQGTPSGGAPRIANGWVEYSFPAAVTVRESRLYWFDDTGRGGVRVPAAWRILYKEGDAWKPVETAERWGLEKNRYNSVAFQPVTTTGLRLEVEFQDGFSAGVQRWRVK
jgi:hypothetical protein